LAADKCQIDRILLELFPSLFPVANRGMTIIAPNEATDIALVYIGPERANTAAHVRTAMPAF
jgi:hypothetical protein